jgi:glycosyltransferase involved in cell wall biosynthesis
MMKPTTPIVYCSSVDWESAWERMHQFAWMFAQERTVLFVDNPGVRPLRWDHFPRIMRRLSRTVERQHASQYHARPEPLTLQHLSPLLIPSPTDALSMRINRRWFTRQLTRAMARMGIVGGILWTSSPTDPVVGIMDAWPWKAVVYDCVDDLPALHPARARQLQAAEDALLRRADVVVATSQALVQKLHNRGRTAVHYIPNGLELDRFAGEHAMPDALARLPRPIVGVLGQMLPNVVDLELVIELAKTHPEWSVVLVGPIEPSMAKRLADADSPVHCTGPVRYEQVPAYLQAFDVALIPFLESPLTRAIHPLKVYEYLYCGLPVVSTRLPELDQFGDLVLQASGFVNFSAAVNYALDEGTSRANARRQAAREHSWDARFAQVTALLGDR